jgi:predicted Rossmann-fold nucleotide-binding protein
MEAQETMKRICVFAGSSPGSRKEYLAAAQELGQALVRRQIGLVYGGAHVGLMGALADAVLAAHGHVRTRLRPMSIGWLPQGTCPLGDRESAGTPLG